MQKRYTVKTYDFAGTYIKTFNPSQIVNEIRFSNKINGGQGQCNIDLSLPIDDFDEGNSIDHMNIVKIYETDDVYSTTPRLIFTGFVSQYVPYFKEGSQGVKLTLLGLASLLSFSYFKNGASFTVTKSNRDPQLIMQDIIDHFNGVYAGNLISYSGGHMDAIGTNVTITFTDKKWADAIKKSFELAGAGWWWNIREDGQMWLKQKPGSATHRFTLGYDVEEGEIVKNNEHIINQYQLRWGSPATNSDYTDAASKTAYGERGKIESDTNLANQTTADQKGNQKVQGSKDAKVQAKLRINTNYDIESIKPGDSCSVFNTKNGSTIFPTNMLITSVSYAPDYVEIELENELNSFGSNFKKAVQEITT